MLRLNYICILVQSIKTKKWPNCIITLGKLDFRKNLDIVVLKSLYRFEICIQFQARSKGDENGFSRISRLLSRLQKYNVHQICNLKKFLEKIYNHLYS